jgi:glycerol-3-phosphate acyltransferase PlsY
MIIIFLSLLSYLLGTFPSGRICAKIFKLGDLQSIGSGNTGATNVLRTGHKLAAFITLLLDAVKGTLAVNLVCFTSHLTEIHQFIALLFGGWAFIGHVYPIWYQFNGGKGVATYLGILFGLNPIFGVFGCVLWLIGAFLSKISSVGALNMAILIPMLLLLTDLPTINIIFFTGLSLILIFKHKENIYRIIHKTEPKIGKKNHAS